MKHKSFTAAVIAAILLFTLTACGKAQIGEAPVQETADVQETPAVAQTSTTEAAQLPAGEDAAAENADSADEAWKTEFEKSLFENYGVKPEYYEDLGGGIYQVYVEIDGKIVPYVAVDSATGDYHG